MLKINLSKISTFFAVAVFLTIGSTSQPAQAFVAVCPDGLYEGSCSTPTVRSCAVVRCGYGSECIDTQEGAKCIPMIMQPATCATLKCNAGSSCAMTQSGPTCVANSPSRSCATVRCGYGAQCVETVSGPQCIVLPECPSGSNYNANTGQCDGWYRQQKRKTFTNKFKQIRRKRK